MRAALAFLAQIPNDHAVAVIEHAAGHALHISGGDMLDRVKQTIGISRIAEADHGIRQLAGAAISRLAPLQRGGDDFVLGFVKLLRRHRLVAYARDFGVEAG